MVSANSRELPVVQDVQRGFDQQSRVIAKVPEPKVAVEAKQSSDLPGRMTVVNVEMHVLLAGEAGLAAADRTSTALRFKLGVVRFFAHPVRAVQILVAVFQFVLSGLANRLGRLLEACLASSVATATAVESVQGEVRIRQRFLTPGADLVSRRNIRSILTAFCHVLLEGLQVYWALAKSARNHMRAFGTRAYVLLQFKAAKCFTAPFAILVNAPVRHYFSLLRLSRTARRTAFAMVVCQRFASRWMSSLSRSLSLIASVDVRGSMVLSIPRLYRVCQYQIQSGIPEMR